MPPELQRFIQTFGRLPAPGIQGEIELLNFSNQTGPILSPPMGTPGGAPFPDRLPQGDFQLPLSDDIQQARLRTFRPDLQPSFPGAAERRGFPGGPGPIFSPDMGAPGGAPLPLPDGPGPILSPPMGDPGGAPLPGGPTTGSAFGLGAPTDPTLAAQIDGILGRLDELDSRLAGPDQEVARARLGGGPGGFSFAGGGGVQPPGQPSAAPMLGGGPDFGAVTPNVGPTGSGAALSALGQQQQADVANQQAQAASVMSSLIGGTGGILGGIGGLGGGGGQQPQQRQQPAPAPAPAPGSFEDRVRRASLLRSGGLGRVF